jgi:glycosyltransferase involved in cell wall biosynthesis
MLRPPRLSIVTPSYNQGNFLENAILSVLEQGYKDLEYFVMDGGSTDGSVEIIRKYAKYITYWQSQPDGGQVEAINAGFGKSTGEIFAYLNSDDFLLQGAIQHILELYREYPQAAGWAGGGYSIAQDGYIIQTRLPQKVGRDDLANWEANWIFQPSCFFSAKAARTVGFLNKNYQNAFDFDFWMRITNAGDLIPTQTILAVATVHADTKTQKYLARMFEEVQAIQRAYGYESYAQATQTFIDQARTQKAVSTTARLLYMTHSQKKKTSDRFVRLPAKSLDV